MAVDVPTLRRKVGAASTATTDDDLNELIETAATLVAGYIGTAEVPDEVIDRAHMLVAVELYHQDEAPNGIVNQQYDAGTDSSTGSTPIRISLDPMRPAYPVLARWVSSKGMAF